MYISMCMCVCICMWYVWTAGAAYPFTASFLRIIQEVDAVDIKAPKQTSIMRFTNTLILQVHTNIQQIDIADRQMKQQWYYRQQCIYNNSSCTSEQRYICKRKHYKTLYQMQQVGSNRDISQSVQYSMHMNSIILYSIAAAIQRKYQYKQIIAAKLTTIIDICGDMLFINLTIEIMSTQSVTIKYNYVASQRK